MSKFKNIKIGISDLPKAFTVSNDWMDKAWYFTSHGEANWYVAINKKYAAYWHDYNDLCRHMSSENNPLSEYKEVEVHGWLTFGSHLSKIKWEIKKAYLELEWTSEDDDVRIYWFDTNHYWDNAWTWTTKRVEEEAKWLAKQMLSFYIVNDND